MALSGADSPTSTSWSGKARGHGLDLHSSKIGTGCGRPADGGLADAIGGIASIVLAIIALNGAHREAIMSIGRDPCFGATLLTRQ
jgi:hypothetical protein